MSSGEQSGCKERARELGGGCVFIIAGKFHSEPSSAAAPQGAIAPRDERQGAREQPLSEVALGFCHGLLAIGFGALRDLRGASARFRNNL